MVHYGVLLNHPLYSPGHGEAAVTKGALGALGAEVLHRLRNVVFFSIQDEVILTLTCRYALTDEQEKEYQDILREILSGFIKRSAGSLFRGVNRDDLQLLLEKEAC